MFESPCARGITMDLDWLRDFLALADEKNFSRAADSRHVTLPAFSRRIRALEDWIGTPLFERSAQGATLTPAGVHFRPLAEELMRTLRRAQRETRAVGTRQTESLSMATHALSFTFFPGWIRKHLQLGALGTLSLISDSMEACEEIMLAGEVDFLLCIITQTRRRVSIPTGFRALRWGPTPSFPSARPMRLVIPLAARTRSGGTHATACL